MGLLKDINTCFSSIKLSDYEKREAEAERLVKEGFECTCTFDLHFQSIFDRLIEDTENNIKKKCIALNKKEKKLWCGKKAIEYFVGKKSFDYKRNICKPVHTYSFCNDLQQQYKKYHKSEPEPAQYFFINYTTHKHIEENAREICKDTKQVYEYKVIKEK